MVDALARFVKYLTKRKCHALQVRKQVLKSGGRQCAEEKIFG